MWPGYIRAPEQLTSDTFRIQGTTCPAWPQSHRGAFLFLGDHMLWMAQPPAGWRDFKANAQADFYAEMGENGGGRQSHRDGYA